MALILGTAGHIDHGKTSLVRALTGIDYDRLEEEKRRGITIELGFAWVPMPGGERLGIVDVPGHERFVKNMVAGAAGVDFVMLVIAADEGVMPQTREHLEICSLLGIRHGFVALTKVDMVDADWLELVQEDVRTFLQGTFLEGAPIFPVSSSTGQGIPALREHILACASSLPPRHGSDIFRLPVDRVFTLKGHGTVITGTVISGAVSEGDELCFMPGALPTRARSLQRHGSSVEMVRAGERCAVNVQGLEVTDIHRGNTLCRPDTLFPSRRWLVRLQCLKSAPRPLRQRTEVHFHHATQECAARVVFFDRDRLAPGDSCLAELRFSSDMVGVFGDHCVLRAYSPLRTVAGGTIVSPLPPLLRRKDPDFRIANLDYDDPDTYAMLAKGETEGIFQLESTGMTQVLVGMRPKNLEDIIALISLYRPGPMDSIPTYLRNRKDPSHVTYKTPQMAHIVDVTNGVVIYQEQVMQICRELAGFSFGQADNVRRAMSKKKLKVMEAEREHFVHGCKEPGKECAGCVANGVPENIANEIYDDMISFASYAFNKSHAACYAYVAFQTAYLKCHYPHEFMAALLTSVLDNTSKVIEYTTECQRLGIKVQQPDINVSRGGFTADGERIRFGLNAVKSVGRDLIEAVIKERAERPYSSLYDFCKRLHGTGLNRRALENLVKAGAFDTLEPTRHGMLESVEGILKSVETDARQNLDGQMDLFGLMGGGEDEKPANDYKVPNLPEYSASDLLKMEKEVSGLYLSGHPLDAYRAQIAQVSTCTIAQLLGEDAKQFDNQTVTLVCTIVKNKIMTTKSNTLMAFTTVEDLTGSMELLVFPRILAECRAALQENAVVVANGRVSVKEDEAARLIVEGVQPIETYDPGKNFGMNRVERVKRETSGGGAAGYFLTVPSRDSAQMHKVENLLCNIFDGGTVRVYFRFQDTGRAMLARHMAVKDDPLLRAELERILGKDCVKVQDIEHSAK